MESAVERRGVNQVSIEGARLLNGGKRADCKRGKKPKTRALNSTITYYRPVMWKKKGIEKIG